jgi:4-hydroxy-3-methylbut-2-enyl diphosphate reductase
MKLILANPRGFCAGVERAIEIAERALDLFGAPVYLRHEIVHNQYVVDGLRARGAVFVEDVADVPDGSTVIFSAHGVAPTVWREAEDRNLSIIDATCPLVAKVHLEVVQCAREGRTVILIGHRNHVEVVGTLGHYQSHGRGTIHVIESEHDAATIDVPPDAAMSYVTQTTLSVDDTARIVAILRQRFPQLRGPHKNDICYATQNRQRATRELAERCDVLIVVGARHSSNSVRMEEVASATGTATHLVPDAAQLEPEWFAGHDVIGVTSGASVPERLVDDVIERIRQWWPGLTVDSFGLAEDLHFRLPRELEPAAGRARQVMVRM